MIRRAIGIVAGGILGASCLGGCVIPPASASDRTIAPLSVVIAQTVPSKLAKYEPENGCYLGAYIDLDPLLKSEINVDGRTHKDPREFESITRKAHASYFFYMGYGRPVPMAWLAKLTEMNKFVHIALEPNEGLDAVQDNAYLQKLADDLRESGAKIFLRFASEMNGTWVKYHGDPEKYKAKFRMVHDLMAKRAPNVAMVWCPYTMPADTIDDYYPGDDAVDWVGVNMYNVTFFNQNPRRPARQITPSMMLSHVYRTYSARKPIMICEYGCTHYSALEDKVVVDFAQNNIKYLYASLIDRFPRVKSIHYFNTNNMLLSHRKNNDYSVTSHPEVLDTYRNAISPSHFLSAPVQLTWDVGRPASEVKEVSGDFRISGELNSAVRALRVRNGYVVLGESAPGLPPSVVLNSGQLPRGESTLWVEALDAAGQVVAQRSILVKAR